MCRTLITKIGLPAFLSACSLAAQSPIVLKPEVTAIHSEVGKGLPLQVVVADERPRKNLGTRGVRGVGSELTIASDMAETVRVSVNQALDGEGFKTGTVATPDARKLKIEIRDLQYTVIMGLWESTAAKGVAN